MLLTKALRSLSVISNELRHMPGSECGFGQLGRSFCPFKMLSRNDEKQSCKRTMKSAVSAMETRNN